MAVTVPPMPEGWNKTQADLVAEMRRGERDSVGSPETDWAREYQRNLVRASMPLGWNKTIRDLVDVWQAGESTPSNREQLNWAREYERGCIVAAGMRFPKKGDVYEALEDMHVRYMTSWSAPYTGGGDGDIFKGERFYVDRDLSEPDPTGVYVLAVKYDELETRMVPESDRQHPKYSQFYFPFSTVELNEKFRLVHEE